MADGHQLLVESLPAHEPVSGAVAWDDQRTRDGLKVSWKGPVAVLGAGLIAMLVAASDTPIAFVGDFALFALIVGVIVRLVFWRRDRRRLRSVLQSGQWTLVNVVILADMLGRDLSGWEQFLARGHPRKGLHYGDKVVAIIDPGTGEVRGTWLPFTRTHPWPGLDVRRWAWLVTSPTAKDATIAPIDRSAVVGLRKGPGFAKALHDHAWNVLRSADLPPAPGGRPMGTVEVGVSHPPDEPERWPNRPMSIRARVVIVGFLAALTVVAGVGDTLAHRSKIEHREELVQNGTKATAKVIGDRSDRRSSDRLTLLIVDGPYAGSVGTRKVDGGPKKLPGDTVTVFHAQDDIDDLVIVGYDQDDRDTGWILGGATIAVAIGLWAAHRRQLPLP